MDLVYKDPLPDTGIFIHDLPDCLRFRIEYPYPVHVCPIRYTPSLFYNRSEEGTHFADRSGSAIFLSRGNMGR